MENNPNHIVKLSDSYFEIISKEANVKMSISIEENKSVTEGEEITESSIKAAEEIKIENLKILKTIGTGKIYTEFLKLYSLVFRKFFQSGSFKTRKFHEILRAEDHVHGGCDQIEAGGACP